MRHARLRYSEAVSLVLYVTLRGEAPTLAWAQSRVGCSRWTARRLLADVRFCLERRGRVAPPTRLRGRRAVAWRCLVVLERLLRGEQLTVADVAALVGLSTDGAWRLLDRMSYAAPLTSDPASGRRAARWFLVSADG